jgi:hypothetical protein
MQVFSAFDTSFRAAASSLIFGFYFIIKSEDSKYKKQCAGGLGWCAQGCGYFT